jgi:pyruvate/2-oxoglutarate dehydrogenase complex dihydrolipoamide acyltransferase (E2) component
MNRPRKIEIKMPLLAPEEPEIEVIRWLVPEGAPVAIDQDLLVLKVDGEEFMMPSPVEGVLLSRAVEPDEMIATGQVLAVVLETM